jgi:hypothetical protein
VLTADTTATLTRTLGGIRTRSTLALNQDRLPDCGTSAWSRRPVPTRTARLTGARPQAVRGGKAAGVGLEPTLRGPGPRGLPVADPAMVRRQGLEPRHRRLRACCSVIELAARNASGRAESNRVAPGPGPGGAPLPLHPVLPVVELERFELSSVCLQGRCVSSYDHSPWRTGCREHKWLSPCAAANARHPALERQAPRGHCRIARLPRWYFPLWS